jgi:hypothetical protein
MNDQINPSHYNKYKYKPIDFFKDLFSKDQFDAYCISNVIKYICRWKDKGGVIDLQKARWFLINNISHFEVYTDAGAMDNCERFRSQLGYREAKVIKYMLNGFSCDAIKELELLIIENGGTIDHEDKNKKK